MFIYLFCISIKKNLYKWKVTKYKQSRNCNYKIHIYGLYKAFPTLMRHLCKILRCFIFLQLFLYTFIWVCILLRKCRCGTMDAMHKLLQKFCTNWLACYKMSINTSLTRPIYWFSVSSEYKWYEIPLHWASQTQLLYTWLSCQRLEGRKED